MRSCFTCIKFLVTFFNCLIMILGLVLTGLFSWIYFELWVMSELSNTSATYVLYFFIGIGAAMTIMGFLGCCGALQESPCLLGTFFTLLLTLYGLQVGIGVWTYNNFDVIEKDFREALKITMYKYDESQGVKAFIDILQHEFSCCGSNGPSDWKFEDVKKSLENHGGVGDVLLTAVKSSVYYEVPESCCAVSVCDRNIALTSYFNPTVNSKGCSDVIFSKFRDSRAQIIIVGIVMSIIQLLAAIFSIVLCATFRKINNYY